MTKRKTTVSDDEVADGKKEKATFPLVALGSSAGGLEVIETFFRNVPSETGMAFVIVTHLDPRHPSLLAEIISKSTTMEVVQAENEMAIQKNTVYVIPPGKEMIAANGHLRLSERRDDSEPFMPIDVFLTSLAEDRCESAIAVILSGNGSDGSFGLRSIHSNLGMIMVQSPETAKYASMPRSAIETGLADYVLPPSEMPSLIVKYVDSLRAGTRTRTAEAGRTTDNIHKILSILKRGTGQDFSLYKKSTINRRIERRMIVHQLKSKTQYATYLERNPKEIQSLFKELTIEVTGFFRNPKVFESLKEALRKAFFDSGQAEGTSRIWVAGCSTGEEAYSISIILRELVEETGKTRPFQIFASDINEDAIIAARTGIYPAAIAKDVGPKRLEKYFIKEEAGYRVRKEVREMVIFATHNVIQNPPFLRVDLLSCRNLLIYFEPILQRKVLETFSAALNPNGIILLGESESISGFEDKFATLDSRGRLYIRRAYNRPIPKPDTVAQAPSRKSWAHEEAGPAKAMNLSATAENILLSEYTPPSLIINDKNEIVYFHGRTGKYLEHTPGKATLGIQDMLRKDIRFAVMSAIGESRRTEKMTTNEAVLIDQNKGESLLTIVIRPMEEIRSISGLMVIFKESALPKRVVKKRSSSRSLDSEARIEKLEQALAYTKENLQLAVEKLETSNEELTSINEELQSSNEELQSVAEESLTAKEELNSLNEELMTVNAELERKNQELMLTSGDMRNLLNGVDVATIFLDIDLKIRRYTSQTGRLMNLLPTDVGRPIQDIAMNLRYEDLLKDVKDVAENLNTKEKEIQTKEGLWYNLKILPYRTLENVIDGVVITFTSIDSQKRTQERLEEMSDKIGAAKEFANNIINTVKEPLLVLDQDLIAQFANVPFYKMFEVKKGEVEGVPLDRISNGALNAPRIVGDLKNLIAKDVEMENLRTEIALPRSGRKPVSITARKLILAAGKSKLILITIGR